MGYLVFVIGFVIIHTVSYTFAGVSALAVSKDLHKEKGRLLDFLRNMSDPDESKHVSRHFVPAQLVRGLLTGWLLF